MADERTATAAPAINWSELARAYWEAQPHPQAPNLKIGEFPIAVQLATRLKQGGGHAEAAEAAAFWEQYRPLMERGLGPDQFLQRLGKLEQLSQVFHGRPPTFDEIETLPTEDPAKLRAYYANLPDKDYPHVPAGDMVARLNAAKQYSNLVLNRDPTKGEAAFFFHAGLNGTGILQHYQLLAADQAAKGQEPGQAPQEGGLIDLRPASALGKPPLGPPDEQGRRVSEGVVIPGGLRPEEGGGSIARPAPAPAPAPAPESGGSGAGLTE